MFGNKKNPVAWARTSPNIRRGDGTGNKRRRMLETKKGLALKRFQKNFTDEDISELTEWKLEEVKD